MSDFGKAVVAMLAELPQVKKDSVNPHFKSRYASLETIMSTVTPVLLKHGMFITHSMPPSENGDVAHVETSLYFQGQKSLTTVVSIPVARADAQGFGSAMTYAKRYGVCMILGIVPDDDDDGNAAVKATEAKAKPAAGIKIKTIG